MAAPLGLSTTNTNASFVFNNMQAVQYGSNSGNTNSVVAIPNVQALDFQSAQFMSGRQPGGVAFRKPSNTALTAAGNANASIIMLDDMVTATSRLGYTKNGAFLVSTNAAAVVVPLTNTQTNTNSFAGDNVFATINQAIIYNLSGLDGNAGLDCVVLSNGTNGVNVFGATGLTVKMSSRVCVENINGVAVAASTANMSINCNGNVAVVLSGS